MKTGTLFVIGMLFCAVGAVRKTGDSLTVNTNVTRQPTEPMLWYFNNILIALINGGPSNSCLYYGEGGIFRDRRQVDYESGSLTIKNITAEHAGFYEAVIIRSESAGTSISLNRTSKCNSTKVTKMNNSMGTSIKSYFFSDCGPEKTTEAEPRENSGLSAGAVALLIVVLPIVSFVGFLLWKRAKSSTNEKREESVSFKV